MKQLKDSKTLNKFNLRVGDELFKFNLNQILYINEDNLEEEGEYSVANFGYFSILKAKVGRKVSDLQLQANQLLAQNFNLAKEEEVGTRVSDKYAEQQALEDSDYVELLKEINLTKEHFYILSGVVESLKLKVNIIQTLSANQRKT